MYVFLIGNNPPPSDPSNMNPCKKLRIDETTPEIGTVIYKYRIFSY